MVIGGIGEPLARIYMAQLVNTVEYMQSMEMVHRDLQPANIMIDNEFNIKIIDFSEAMNVDLTSPSQE